MDSLVMVSIIIPIYNVEEYIVKCLESVMEQTYGGLIECILVDDCGSDKSMALAEKRIADYVGKIEFRIIRHERNRGLSGARNTGTHAARGEYIFYLDSDDTIMPRCIEQMMGKVDSHPGLEMVQGATETDPYDDFYSIERYIDKDIVEDNVWIRREFYRQRGGLQVNAWNKLVSRKFIEDNGLYFREGIIHEDQQWMFFVVKKLQSMSFVQEKTYYHYRNPQSIMKSSGKKKSDDNWALIMRDVVENIDEPQGNQQLLKYVLVYASRFYKESSDYKYLKDKIGELLKERGYKLGSTLCDFAWRMDNELMRTLLRRYCKYWGSRC